MAAPTDNIRKPTQPVAEELKVFRRFPEIILPSRWSENSASALSQRLHSGAMRPLLRLDAKLSSGAI